MAAKPFAGIRFFWPGNRLNIRRSFSGNYTMYWEHSPEFFIFTVATSHWLC